MDLNALYQDACCEDRMAEKRLFELLAARFEYIVRQKIWNRDDSEEVVQNALTAVAQNYRQVRLEVSFAAWAQRILENKVVDYFRTRKRHQNVFQELSDGDDSGFAADSDHETRQRLLDCLKKVNVANQRHARILVLKYQGYEFDEICRRLHLTRNNAYSVLSRARTMLERCLEKGILSDE
jgi:RNA polymerase sigma-70 factor, ECF subfamily